MSSLNASQPFQFLISVFRVAGIWNDHISWSFLQLFYLVVVQLAFFVSFFLSMCINLAFIESIESITESLYMTLTTVSLMVKIVNIVMKHKKLLNFVKGINASLIQPHTEQEIQLFRRAYKNFNRQRNTFFGSAYFCLVAALYSSAIGRDRLPFPGWYPLDWKNNERYFWIIYGYQILAMGLSCTTNAAADLMNGYMFFQIAIFFRMISKRIENIGHSGYNGKELPNGEACRKLLECIRMHQFVTRLANDAQDILTWPIFVQFNTGGIVLCFTAFQMTLLSPIADTGTFFLYFLFMVCMLFENSLPCYYGNEVIVESGQVLTSLYFSNWPVLSMEYKKHVFHFMEGLKKPITPKAGGYFTIGLVALASIIRGAYSLFALIINLEN